MKLLPLLLLFAMSVYVGCHRGNWEAQAKITELRDSVALLNNRLNIANTFYSQPFMFQINNTSETDTLYVFFDKGRTKWALLSPGSFSSMTNTMCVDTFYYRPPKGEN